MDHHTYEWTSTQNTFSSSVSNLENMSLSTQSTNTHSYSNLAMIEVSIVELITLINMIRDYENPYQYITFMDNDTSKQITVEIIPEILTLPNEIIQNQLTKFGNKSNIVQAILSKYSILDHEKQYKLTKDISIETKINMIYAESIKYSKYYCESVLPPKYVPMFIENGYRNIYEKVKDELFSELNLLVAKKIEWIGLPSVKTPARVF